MYTGTVKTAFYDICGQRPPAFYDRNSMHGSLCTQKSLYTLQINVTYVKCNRKLKLTLPLQLGPIFTLNLNGNVKGQHVDFATGMDEDEQLVETVRDYPCLYNRKSNDFNVLMKKRTPGLQSLPD